MSDCFHCNRLAHRGKCLEGKLTRVQFEYFNLVLKSDKPGLIQHLLYAEARGLPILDVLTGLESKGTIGTRNLELGCLVFFLLQLVSKSAPHQKYSFSM